MMTKSKINTARLRNKEPSTYQKMRAIVRKWDDLIHFMHYDYRQVDTIDLNSHARIRMSKTAEGHTLLEILES